MKYCRHCAHELTQEVLDLGAPPPSNSYLTDTTLNKPELTFPLRILFCEHCFLVQTEDYAASSELFASDYAYLSSTSHFWIEHAKNYCEKITNELALNEDHFVVEVAANDGYLLDNFVAKHIPCLGIEPTQLAADIAKRKGIPICQEFFSLALAEQLVKNQKQADLIIANNVLAHVPDIDDFVQGLACLLASDGTITVEFPHLLNLIRETQFDTIYHEHFSYLSLQSVINIFLGAELVVYHVEELASHGGSLRVYAAHQQQGRYIDSSVEGILAREHQQKLDHISCYRHFQKKAIAIKNNFLEFLIQEQRQGHRVVGYGAAAKANTLLNYAGVKKDLIAIIYDAAESKQYKYMPGSRIPILPPSLIKENIPDTLIIFPWNIAGELLSALAWLKDEGTRIYTVIPEIKRL